MAGAGYKLFNTGDVLTAAQVNTYLQEQAVMVFADSTARTTALSGVLAEGMISYLKNDDKVYKYTGSAWVEVGGGGSTTGYVIQVKSTTKTDTFTSSTTGAFTDITGLSVSITPSSTSSKIFVCANVSVAGTYTSAGQGLRLVRDTTALAVGDAAGSRRQSTAAAIGSDANFQYSLPLSYLDSPSTTSATTYKVQFLVDAGSFYLNRSTNDTNSAGLHRTASTITVMEIGG